MANSLRAQITHLKIKGKITRDEYDWFMKKAHGHDEKLKDFVATICAEEVSKINNICGRGCPVNCEWGTEKSCKRNWKEHFLKKVAETPFM